MDGAIVRLVVISIHALRKESDRQSVFCHRTVRISIHALRKESDACRLAGNGSVLISIHALRKESDKSAENMRRVVSHFNPRSP